MEIPGYRTGTGLLRALSRRCPVCGHNDVFRNWLETRAACPGCHVRMDRGEDDFFLGAFTINFIVMELMVVAFLVGTVLVTWPAVPWDLLVWAGAPVAILAPILFYPFSRTLWLSLDLAMRPPEPKDFAVPGAEDTPPGPELRRVS